MDSRLLSVAPSPAFYGTVGLYVIAGVLWFISAGTNRRWVWWAVALTFVAVLSHLVDIGWRSFLRVHPAQSIREAAGFLAMILAAGSLGATWRRPSPLLMMITTPVVIVLYLAARLSPAGQATVTLTMLGRTHIILATLGLAAFAIASLLSAVYLFEQRSLKKKRFDTLSYRAGGTPLESLDNWSHRLAWIGWPLFTVAIVLGVIWSRQRDLSLVRLETFLTVLAWILFSIVLGGRVAKQWAGRLSAKVMVTGFVVGLLAVATYLLRRVLG